MSDDDIFIPDLDLVSEVLGARWASYDGYTPDEDAVRRWKESLTPFDKSLYNAIVDAYWEKQLEILEDDDDDDEDDEDDECEDDEDGIRQFNPLEATPEELEQHGWLNLTGVYLDLVRNLGDKDAAEQALYDSLNRIDVRIDMTKKVSLIGYPVDDLIVHNIGIRTSVLKSATMLFKGEFRDAFLICINKPFLPRFSEESS